MIPNEIHHLDAEISFKVLSFFYPLDFLSFCELCVQGNKGKGDVFTPSSVKQMKLAELKDALKARGLSVAGTKKELSARLLANK